MTAVKNNTLIENGTHCQLRRLHATIRLRQHQFLWGHLAQGRKNEAFQLVQLVTAIKINILWVDWSLWAQINSTQLWRFVHLTFQMNYILSSQILFHRMQFMALSSSCFQNVLSDVAQLSTTHVPIPGSQEFRFVDLFQVEVYFTLRQIYTIKMHINLACKRKT